MQLTHIIRAVRTSSLHKAAEKRNSIAIECADKRSSMAIERAGHKRSSSASGDLPQVHIQSSIAGPPICYSPLNPRQICCLWDLRLMVAVVSRHPDLYSHALESLAVRLPPDTLQLLHAGG